MEDDLDKIAAGERNWVTVLSEFYDPFKRQLQAAARNMKPVQIAPEETGLLCDKCGHPMIVKVGRYGKFIACSSYPECRNTKPYVVKTGVKCPQCGGDLVERRTRRKRTFYGCASYPDCEFAVWQRPVPESCPKCGGLMVESGRTQAKCIRCQHILTREAQAEGSA